jgi:hypothetical protein
MRHEVDRPKSLFDVWKRYSLSVRATQSDEKAHAILSQTKTSLLRYTMPGWGFPVPQKAKLTEWETERGLEAMKQIAVEQLGTALVAQQRVFKEKNVRHSLMRTYRSALNRLLKWCEEQSWWQKEDGRPIPKLTPVKKRQGSATDIRVTQRRYKDDLGNPLIKYKYGLGAVEGDVITERLQAELEAFSAWRTGRLEPRLKRPISRLSLEKELSRLHLILGWLHRFKGIPTYQLTFEQMMPFVPIEGTADLQKASGCADVHSAIARAEDVAQKTLELALDYINWLRLRGANSETTELDVVKTFLAVARFVYRHEIQDIDKSNQVSSNQDVPIIRVFRSEIAQRQKILRDNRDSEIEAIISRQAKMPSWREFLAFVEQLRAECTPKLRQGNLTGKDDVTRSSVRSLTAIAHSYQRFLFAAMLSYIPPQRQQVYRNLLVGDYRDYESIDNFPLPEEVSGYLYSEAGRWYVHLFRDRYKTGKNYSEYQLEIPNIRYPDGRWFYQYLDEWINEFNYPAPSGEVQELKGLRQAFNPSHQYLFTKKNGEKYSHPTELSNLLRNATYRILGCVLNPHHVRHIFITYCIRELPREQDKSEALAVLMPYPLKPDETYDMYMKAQTLQLGCRIAREAAENFVPVDD